MENRITIFDTTLRDGEQAPGFSMTVDQKLRMALQLERLGVDVMEAGFPVASQGDFDAVKTIAEAVTSCQVAGLCRASQRDIDRAWDALKMAKAPRIHTFIATSDIHLEHKLKMSRQQVLQTATKAVAHACQYTDNVEFSAEDAVRTDLDYLCQIVEAVINAGAAVVNIPDTVGYALPGEFGEMIRTLRQRVPNIGRAVLSVHCHNDLGLAVANSLAAVDNGARQVEGTVNGIGERAGNASLEEFVMALHTRKPRLNLECQINTREIFRTSRLLSSLTASPVPRNKAIVGENAFAHEAGIHQHGVINFAGTYEIMTPEDVGVPKSSLVLGKHSGRHALAQRCQEMGYPLTEDELKRVYSDFTDLADRKKIIFDADLLALMENRADEIPDAFSLSSMQIISGTGLMATATLRLQRNDVEMEDSAIGDGPVNAVFKAVDRITGFSGRLIHYSLQSVSEGQDALGEVTLQVEFQGERFSGRGFSTDVVEASARAYLQAVSRALSVEEDILAVLEEQAS